MAYFSSGSEGSHYTQKYCDRCIHGDGPCPVLWLHLEWNYEAIGNATKKTALNTLWPVTADGIHNEACKLFHDKGESDNELADARERRYARQQRDMARLRRDLADAKRALQAED